MYICVPSSQLMRPLCQFRICIVCLVLARTVSQNFAFYTCPCVRSWYLGLGTVGSICGSHFINSVLGSFVAYKTDSDQKTALLWLKASKRNFQHNFWWHKWVIFLKEYIQTVFRAFNKHWRPTKCIATLLREVGYFFSRKNWEATSLNNIIYKKGSS